MIYNRTKCKIGFMHQWSVSSLKMGVNVASPPKSAKPGVGGGKGGGHIGSEFIVTK